MPLHGTRRAIKRLKRVDRVRKKVPQRAKPGKKGAIVPIEAPLKVSYKST